MTQPPPPTTARNFWHTVMPALFVPLWSTGFIGAKYGLPYIEPLTFLCLRYGLVLLLVLLALAIQQPPRLSRPQIIASLQVGMLIHASYLGGVFWSIHAGMPAGIAAVVVGLQPILTALIGGYFLGERTSLRQWGGLVLGLIGVGGVLLPGLAHGLEQTGGHDAIPPATIAATGFSLLAITVGTVLQRARGQGIPLWSGAFWQYLGALAVSLPLALLLETRHIEWNGHLVFALAWLVLVLSIGAISLLVLMLRHGAASRVATLFYLVPPFAALIAWLMFDEQLMPIQLAGMALAALGVWLATRARQG